MADSVVVDVSVLFSDTLPAWFYHAGDTECLEQAYLVAGKHVINFDEIARWSVGEGKTG